MMLSVDENKFFFSNPRLQDGSFFRKSKNKTNNLLQGWGVQNFD